MLDEKLLQDVWDDLENQNKTFFETGFEDLDCVLGIQEKKGAVITIGARPAMGKTTFMLSIMENILLKNKKCIYFSLEMSKEQLVKRILFQRAEVSFIKSKLNNYVAKDWEKLANAMNNLSKWDLFVDDSSAANTKEIEAAIKEQKPDVVFIDYFQLLGGKPKQDRLIQIEENMKALKRIAKENGVVIIIASQLSRAVENRYDKRPLLSDLRESGAIENISDVVIFLYRDEYYNSREEYDEFRPKGETEVIVAKNKFGACGSIRLTFKSNIPKFYQDRSA
jgi:replicative DNA helicase